MKKLLSRLFLLVSILVLTCSMASCWLTDKHYEGLGEFSRFHSSVNICMHVPEKMIEEFQYIDGDYHFYSRLLSYDKMLLYLSYNEDEYQSAKSYVISECQIDDSDLFESLNSYLFYIDEQDDIKYPSWYTAIGFSDTYNTIVFIGLYTNEYDYANSSDSSFQQHISKHFGEWYEFK